MAYPVHVVARLDPEVSRGLWLVKWLLVLPHCLVLFFLWLSFGVLSVAAFFSILVTGRYPRSIFDFNVGVLRWQWRVSFYAYSALGTDRYPPFTLHDVPDYPARLEVDYPVHLSRGLVLVKWWLLVLPHYLVVGLLLGGVGYYAVSDDGRSRLWGLGLIPLLVLVAGVVLLVTGRYPRPLFDLVLGLDRWVLRVAGYAALMTDEYPPFRLDQGGREPGDPEGDAADGRPPQASGVAGAPTSAGTGWTTGRTVSLVAGCILTLTAMLLGVPASALLVADRAVRDETGFLMTPAQRFASPTYAIASEDLEMHVDAPPDLTPGALLGDAKLTVTADDGGAVFIGLGPASDVRGYLAGVEHATVRDVVDGEPVFRTATGGAPESLPGPASFWATKAAGAGEQTITWSPSNGDWAVLVMNADGTRDVDVVMTVGAEVPALPWVVAVLLVLAATALAFGTLLIVVSVRGASRQVDVAR